jgi:hypothetical protein
VDIARRIALAVAVLLMAFGVYLAAGSSVSTASTLTYDVGPSTGGGFLSDPKPGPVTTSGNSGQCGTVLSPKIEDGTCGDLLSSRRSLAVGLFVGGLLVGALGLILLRPRQRRGVPSV